MGTPRRTFFLCNLVDSTVNRIFKDYFIIIHVYKSKYPTTSHACGLRPPPSRYRTLYATGNNPYTQIRAPCCYWWSYSAILLPFRRACGCLGATVGARVVPGTENPEPHVRLLVAVAPAAAVRSWGLKVLPKPLRRHRIEK